MCNFLKVIRIIKSSLHPIGNVQWYKYFKISRALKLLYRNMFISVFHVPKCLLSSVRIKKYIFKDSNLYIANFMLELLKICIVNKLTPVVKYTSINLYFALIYWLFLRQNINFYNKFYAQLCNLRKKNALAKFCHCISLEFVFKQCTAMRKTKQIINNSKHKKFTVIFYWYWLILIPD